MRKAACSVVLVVFTAGEKMYALTSAAMEALQEALQSLNERLVAKLK